MTLLLLVPVWLLLMALVAGLCKSARSGDADLRFAQDLSLHSLRVEAEASFAAADLRVRSDANSEGSLARERDGVGIAA
jgi:hypothetical protein